MALDHVETTLYEKHFKYSVAEDEKPSASDPELAAQWRAIQDRLLGEGYVGTL